MKNNKIVNCFSDYGSNSYYGISQQGNLILCHRNHWKILLTLLIMSLKFDFLCFDK